MCTINWIITSTAAIAKRWNGGRKSSCGDSKFACSTLSSSTMNTTWFRFWILQWAGQRRAPIGRLFDQFEILSQTVGCSLDSVTAQWLQFEARSENGCQSWPCQYGPFVHRSAFHRQKRQILHEMCSVQCQQQQKGNGLILQNLSVQSLFAHTRLFQRVPRRTVENHVTFLYRLPIPSWSQPYRFTLLPVPIHPLSHGINQWFDSKSSQLISYGSYCQPILLANGIRAGSYAVQQAFYTA